MPALKKGNVCHVATWWYLKKSNNSNRAFTDSAVNAQDSMGWQAVNDLAYFNDAASDTDVRNAAALEAHNLIQFILQNPATFKVEWEQDYADDQSSAQTDLTASLAKRTNTVFDIAQTVDKIFQYEGEKNVADTALNTNENDLT